MNTKHEDSLVIKSNMLVLSNLSIYRINELRLMDLYLSRINPKDPAKDRFVRFTRQEFCEIMGLHPKTNIHELEKSLRNLRQKTVTFPVKYQEKTRLRNAVLFPTVDVERDPVTDKITFLMACNEDVKDLFFDLNTNGYISYTLKTMIALKNQPAILLYNRLKYQMFIDNEWRVGVQELREILGLTTSAYNEFKYIRRILDESVGEICAKTDINVGFEVIRDGKRASHVRFKISKKKGMAPPQLIQDAEESISQSPHEETISFYGSAFDGAFNTDQVEAIISAYVVSGKWDPYTSEPDIRLKIHDQLAAVYKKGKAKKGVEDVYGYVLKIVENLKK